MSGQKLLQSFVVLSLMVSGIAQAQMGGRPAPYPGPSNGGGGRGGGGPERGGDRGPGPVRPGGDDDCRRDPRSPRCNNGDGRRDDNRGPGRGPGWDGRGGDGRHDGGYRPGRPYNPQPRPPYQPPYNPPYQPPYNPPPVYNPPPSTHNESSIVLNSITRRGGGEWHRITLNYPIRIDYIQTQMLSYSAQIHEAYVTTRSGARYQVRELSGTGTFSSRRASEILNIYEDIIAIDLRIESMGGYADMMVTVVSSDGSTSLSSTRY